MWVTTPLFKESTKEEEKNLHICHNKSNQENKLPPLILIKSQQMIYNLFTTDDHYEFDIYSSFPIVKNIMVVSRKQHNDYSYSTHQFLVLEFISKHLYGSRNFSFIDIEFGDEQEDKEIDGTKNSN